MARIKNGVLGGFSGKAGSVIGFQRRGKSFIKGLNKGAPKPPTLNQLASREKFKLLQNWRSYLTSFFAISFKNHTHERSAQNAAHRFNANIVKGEYPNFEIDYTAIVISQGNLPTLKEVMMTVDENRKLHFTWTDTYEKGAEHSDLVALLIFFNKKSTHAGSTTAAHRMDKGFSFQLSLAKTLTHADVYITVLSDDRERAANSQYVGRAIF